MADRKSTIIQAGGEEITILKARLKLWTALDELQEQLFKEPSPQVIYEYLKITTGRDFWDTLPWTETSLAFLRISLLNIIETDLPMLTLREKAEPKPAPWDYKGRGWYVWVNIFARNYGWMPEYIAELEVEDAFALLQEIETERQLDREEAWQGNELAYPYNKDTKKSEFHPLPRPVWMRAKAGPPKAKKISKALMPVGNVVDMMREYVESHPGI